MSKDKDNRNYRIFRVEEDKKHIFPKKITMLRIHAEDNDDAYKQLKDYIKVANKEYKYYVEYWTPTIVIHNGKKYTYNDIFESFEDERNRKAWYIRAYDAISLWCWRYFIDIPTNLYYKIKNIFYLIKNKQEYSSSWNVDIALLNVLTFNIPILKKYKNCLSWKMLDKAILEENKDMKQDDLRKYHETHCSGYSKSIENRSVELEHQMYDDLIFNIRAYQYYSGDYEFIDPKNKELVELDSKLRQTLPLIKGSYDSYDYKKLNVLAEKHWNRIWETVRLYGREFND